MSGGWVQSRKEARVQLWKLVLQRRGRESCIGLGTHMISVARSACMETEITPRGVQQLTPGHPAGLSPLHAGLEGLISG